MSHYFMRQSKALCDWSTHRGSTLICRLQTESTESERFQFSCTRENQKDGEGAPREKSHQSREKIRQKTAGLIYKIYFDTRERKNKSYL